jgi:hypothetical protein
MNVHNEYRSCNCWRNFFPVRSLSVIRLGARVPRVQAVAGDYSGPGRAINRWLLPGSRASQERHAPARQDAGPRSRRAPARFPKMVDGWAVWHHAGRIPRMYDGAHCRVALERVSALPPGETTGRSVVGTAAARATSAAAASFLFTMTPPRSARPKRPCRAVSASSSSPTGRR